MAHTYMSNVNGTESKEAGPQTPTICYNQQIWMWDMLETLQGGTDAMRKAGDKLMPRYPNESPANYEYRLGRATLLNYFKRTVLGLVGKPFAEPLEVPENYPEDLVKLFDDVDKQGNDLDTFARNAFRMGLAKGMVHILIDFPTADKVATLADEREQGLTPYMMAIPPENVIAMYAETIDGVEKLTHVRIRECEITRQGWEEKTVERVRVLEPGKWTVYTKQEDGKYKETDGDTTSIDYIPMVTFYAEREGLMKSRPPLLDLAHLNVAHWQSSSDQRNVLSVSRFPILVATGVDPTDPITLGPNNYFALRDPTAKMGYLEHGGAAISSGRQDLEDLKTEMAMMGLQLLMPTQSGTLTATAKALDNAESNCGLQALVMEFQNTLNSAIRIMAMWTGKTKDVVDALDDIAINSEYGPSVSSQNDLGTLMQARSSREISHVAFISELRRRGVLPDDFDIEDDQKLLDADKQKDDANGMNGGLPGREGPIKGGFPGAKPKAVGAPAAAAGDPAKQAAPGKAV